MMEHVAKALNDLEKAVRKANGRRRKRLLNVEQVLKTTLRSDQEFKVLRDHTVDGSARHGRFFRHKRQGRTSAALVFRRDKKQFAILRAFVVTRKNGFTELVWGGKWRKKADPFQMNDINPIWVPSAADLLIYSDYLEERGQRRVA